jgi:hypothetical protein
MAPPRWCSVPALPKDLAVSVSAQSRPRIEGDRQQLDRPLNASRLAHPLGLCIHPMSAHWLEER